MSSQLTELERKFVDYIVAGEKHIDAVLKAGYSCTKRSYASTLGANILKRPQVKEYLALRRAEAAERNSLNEDFVIKRLMAIVSADPSKIVGVKKQNCRHCWGIDFKYRFTDEEYEQRLKIAESTKTELEECGGAGFSVSRAPHPDCPHCGGLGVGVLSIADTQELGPNERLLYQGAEYTRNGIKIKMHDQMTAIIKLGDYLGIFESKTVEELRKLQLAKTKAETDALNRQQLPIKVEIQVHDASNPDRTRGELLNDTKTDAEHTSE